MNFKIIFSLAVFLSVQPQVFSWGHVGHRAVCEIAEKKVTPKTRTALRRILGKMSLAQSCTYMDEVRSHPDQDTYKKTFPWHFIEIPDGTDVDHAPRSPEGDALEAMIRFEQKLKSRTGTAFEQFEALAFLGHLVGDIHQPLHVGNGLDRGANICVVSFFRKNTNLHSLWDEGLIDHLQLSFTELARFVDILDAKTESSYRKGDYKDWIMESMRVRDQLYPKVSLDGRDIPGRPYCKQKEEGSVPENMIPQLSWDYAFQQKKLLDQRLVQAGIRYALVLDRIFSGSQVSQQKKVSVNRLPASQSSP